MKRTVLFFLVIMLVLSSYAGAVIALPTSLSPKWYKTLDGYFDDASVWYDGTVHVFTADWLTEFSCISYYTQVSPYGLVKSKYTYNNLEFFSPSLSKGRIGVVAYNYSGYSEESDEYEEFVGVYGWSGRLLWKTNGFQFIYDIALTKAGSIYMGVQKEDAKKYLVKYDSRFNKVFEIEIEPVGEPYHPGEYWINGIFDGQFDDVYVVITYWKYFGFWSETTEIQKFSSNGQLLWVKRLSLGEENPAYGALYISVRNIREVSDKTFVCLNRVNATYIDGWLYTEDYCVLALEKDSGLTLWQYDFPKVVSFNNWPAYLFNMDASLNKIFVLYSTGQDWFSMEHKLCVLDFSGNLISSYDLNLPTGSNPVWYMGTSNYGHVYLITSSVEEFGKTFLMYMGKF